jgi:HD-GYP domain-containing protein (c-di-GMP phosphodiesterase class II)
MAHLLIWGDTQEIVAGGLPAGTPAAEVRSLADLKTAVDGRSPALVLADARRLNAEKDAVEAWLRGGAVAHVVLLAVADALEGEELRRRLPFVDDLLPRPVTPERLLERTAEAFHGRRQAERALRRKHDDLSELNKIGVALSAERDTEKLLEQILSKSREITAADAGSLYLVERAQETDDGGSDHLHFMLTQNDSVEVPFEEKPMALDVTSIAGYVALAGEPLSLEDAYNIPPGEPFKFDRSWDEKWRYRSKSMLTVPMRDHKGVVIGVVQLINKKRGRSVRLHSVSQIEREVIPFTAVDVDLARSLASQAAVAFENAKLIERIQNLFDQFIHRAVAAVELRDPTTAGHSERVAILSVGLIEKVNAASTGPLAYLHFGPEQVKELRYAALLHDFGKVAVEEKYLKKEKKLYASQLIAIKHRFAYILKAIEADYLKARLDALQAGCTGSDHIAAIEAKYRQRRRQARRVLNAVHSANEPKVVEEDSFRALMDLPPPRRFASFSEFRDFPTKGWAKGPFLAEDEVEALRIRKGSLSAKERREIEKHVSHTYEFLKELPWTGEYRQIPEITWKHHEKLDGSGYPNRLLAHEIPVQSRMMTIADIFDALVAWDRPYKDSVPVERALEILDGEAKAGKLDDDLLRVFVEARLHELPEYWDRPEMKGRRKSRA